MKIPDQENEVRAEGKRWMLPAALRFVESGSGLVAPHFFWRAIDYRCPRKGEFYVSGAEPAAWLALNDLRHPHLVVEKTTKARRVQVWVEKEDEE